MCYGVRRSVRWLTGQLEDVTEGTNEFALHSVARSLGYTTEHGLYHTEELARESIRWHVRAGHPVLCCVDVDRDGPWIHWIVLVGAGKKHVTWVDSARPGPVVQRVGWARLFQRLGVRVDPTTRRFDIYPLVTVAQR